MAITPFSIVNEDGSINQSEYTRCINFLNSYVNGTVPVKKKTVWSNPYEIDLTTPKDALSILMDMLKLGNRLLDATAFESLKKLFKGILERYGSTIHTYGKYLQNSQYFLDGPGYNYDVLSEDETSLSSINYSDELKCYYLDDENHTVLEYNDLGYDTYNDHVPSVNFPSIYEDPESLSSNVDTYPNLYKGYLAGIYSDFQKLSGQYVGSSILFYYSECNDSLYTSGGTNYSDDRLSEIINFNYDANVKNKSKPSRGAAITSVTSLQSRVENNVGVLAYIPSQYTNTNVNYIQPTFFTALHQEDFIVL